MDHLLYEISTGLSSVKAAVDTARTATWSAQGTCSRTLLQMAKLGNWGHRPGNAERDLHTFAKAYLPLPLEKLYVPVRVDDGRGNEVVMDLPMFPVREVFSMLWESGPERFAKSCLGPGGHADLALFWHHVSHMPWAHAHPCRGDPDRLPHTIPVTIFGDDARLYKNEKMMVYAWSSFLSREKTLLSKFLIAVIPHWLVLPGKTLPDVEAAIQWTFACAFEGRHPSFDHLGRPIVPSRGQRRHERRGLPLCGAVPYRLALMAVKADLVFEKQCFHFRGFDQHQVCRDCHAHKMHADVLYSQIGEAAAWRFRPRTTAEYVDEHMNDLPRFCGIPGWHLELHRHDPMHNVFLGFGMRMVGSVIVELSTLGTWPGASFKARLASAWVEMREWMKAHRLECSQPRFTPGSFGQAKNQSNYAGLKAKAHNCRVLIAWVSSKCESCADRDGDRGRVRATMAWSLADWCWRVDQHTHWALPVELAETLYQRSQTFLLTYQFMSKWALSQGKRLYAWKPKHHYFEHLNMTVRRERLNPKFLWNYAEEDLIGSAIDIASRVHRLTASARTLDRYYLALGLALLGRGKAPIGPPPWLPANAAI